MKHLATLTFFLASATPLAAQGTFTSPKGFDTIEGATNHDYILASKIGLTWQQLDGTNKGGPAVVLKSIAWRRDAAAATNANYSARTMEMEVVLADTIVSSVTPIHANNYKNAPTVVFTKKLVNAPDWTAKPATTPSTFNHKLPFDTQWPYLGTDDLLWEVRVTQNTAVTGTSGLAYGFDFDYIGQSGATFFTAATGVQNGTGCISTGMTSAFQLTGTLYSHPLKLRLALAAARAPASTPVTVFLDGADSNLTIPGICAVVHALPSISLPLGTSSATGAIATTTFDNLPFNPAFQGQALHFQALALDVGQSGIPVSLSGGLRITVATPPANPGTIARLYSYLSGTTTTAASIWTGGLIAQFDY